MVGYIRPEKSYDSLGKIHFSLSFFNIWVFFNTWFNLTSFPLNLPTPIPTPHTSLLLSLYLSQTLGVSSLTCFLHVLISVSNRCSYYGHQQWHWGGQGQTGAPRASQIERRQLLHQPSQLVFSHAPHHCIHVTDYYKWSLTAGCDCRTLWIQTHRRTRTTWRCM